MGTKLSALTEATSAADSDELYIRDVSETDDTIAESKRITLSSLTSSIRTATTSLKGLLSSADKTILDGLAAVLKSATVGSAVNQLTARNAATGNAPSLEATGSDTNVDLKLVPKGTGAVDLAGASLKRAEVRDYSKTLNEITHSSSGALAIDYEDGPVVRATLQAAVTGISFSNWPSDAEGEIRLHLIQDSTGGRSVTLPTAKGESITVDTTASKETVIVYSTPNGGTTLYAWLLGNGI